MRASTLYGLGIFTIAIPILIGQFSKQNAVSKYVDDFNVYNVVIIIAGFALMWILTALIDRRWKLVRR